MYNSRGDEFLSLFVVFIDKNDRIPNKPFVIQSASSHLALAITMIKRNITRSGAGGLENEKFPVGLDEFVAFLV